jgi:LAO/AO transport system kinase
MSKKKLLENQIKKAAKGEVITCAKLRMIAEETNTSYRLAGKIADELKIKIKNCDLGCF